jgi:hypothetical protein
MLKRIAIFFAVFIAVTLAACGYFWFKDRQLRAQLKKEREALSADMMAETNEWNALGDVNIEPPHVTLVELKQQLHQPGLIQTGGHNSSVIGWACAEAVRNYGFVSSILWARDSAGNASCGGFSDRSPCEGPQCDGWWRSPWRSNGRRDSRS